MEIYKTSLERAFELAKSGTCADLTAIVKKLKSEGYASNHVNGPVLKKQLKELITASKQPAA